MPAVLRKVIAAWRGRVEAACREIAGHAELARYGARACRGLLARAAAAIAARTLLRSCVAGMDQPA